VKQLRADRARLSVQYPDPLRGAILDALNRVLTDPNDLVIASSGSGRLPPRALAIPTHAGWQVKSVAPGDVFCKIGRPQSRRPGHSCSLWISRFVAS
jgi:hypothetical protein